MAEILVTCAALGIGSLFATLFISVKSHVPDRVVRQAMNRVDRSNAELERSLSQFRQSVKDVLDSGASQSVELNEASLVRPSPLIVTKRATDWEKFVHYPARNHSDAVHEWDSSLVESISGGSIGQLGIVWTSDALHAGVDVHIGRQEDIDIWGTAVKAGVRTGNRNALATTRRRPAGAIY